MRITPYSRKDQIQSLSFMKSYKSIVVGFINPGSLMDRLPNKGSPQQATLQTNTQLMGRPKYLNDRPKGRSNLRPGGLAEEE